MAPPAGPSQTNNNNDQDGSACIQPVRELIDTAAMAVSVPAEAPATPSVGQPNLPQCTNETAAAPAGTASKPKAKRKHLLGSRELLVDPKFVQRCAGPDELSVEGKTVKCPNEKTNGSCYKVDWMLSLPNTVNPGCLRHWCHKDSMTKPLRDAISLCEERNGGQPTKVNKKARGAAVASRGGKTNPATPPETQQWRARNNMRTAASASISVTSAGGSVGGSAISSLSHSRSHASAQSHSTDEDLQGCMQPPPRRRTRHALITDPARTVESESDEGESADENDNAHSFQCDREADELGGNKSSNDEDDRVAVAVDQPTGPQKRMWERLKELKWDFVWLLKRTILLSTIPIIVLLRTNHV